MLASPTWRRSVASDPVARLALLTAVALAVSPYLHLNDLVLEAVPLLFLASRRLRPLTRAMLVTWGLGVIPALAVGLGIALAVHTQVISSLGFGILLSGGTLLAVIAAVDGGRPPGPMVAQRAWGPSAPPAASQRR